MVELYKKGTKPKADAPNIIEVGKVKDLLVTAVEQMEKDYESGLFKNYNQYETSYGVTLNSIDDAILFNNSICHKRSWACAYPKATDASISFSA